MKETKYLHVIDKEDVAQQLLETLCILEAVDFIERAERHLRDSEIPEVQRMTITLEEDRELLRLRACAIIAETHRTVTNVWSFGYPLLDVLRELNAIFDFADSYTAGEEITFERVRRVNEVFDRAHTLLKNLAEVEEQ